MKTRILYIVAFLIGITAFGQTPTAKAVNFLPQASNITSPIEGTLFYKNSDNTFYYWDNTQWLPLSAGDLQVTLDLGGFAQSSDTNSYLDISLANGGAGYFDFWIYDGDINGGIYTNKSTSSIYQGTDSTNTQGQFTITNGIGSWTQRTSGILATVNIQTPIINNHLYKVPARTDTATTSYFSLGATDGSTTVYATSNGIVDLSTLSINDQTLQQVLDTGNSAQSPSTNSTIQMNLDNTSPVTEFVMSDGATESRATLTETTSTVSSTNGNTYGQFISEGGQVKIIQGNTLLGETGLKIEPPSNGVSSNTIIPNATAPGDYYTPIIITDGVTNVTANSNGVANISALVGGGGGSGSKTITANTGTTIDLSNPLGNECNYLSANSNLAFTTTGTGGWATVLVNASSEPTVNGVTAPEIGGTFIPSTDIYLVVRHTSAGVKYFWSYKNVTPTKSARTGNTITFDIPADYNATTPATSGNITLDNTNAVAGIIQSFYFNGSTEPTISGITIQARSGLFSANRLNIYKFEYNTNNQVILNILTDNTPQLIAPQNFIATVNSPTEIDISWDTSTNATNYILERDINSDFSTATQIYSGASTSFADSGLTTDTTYYYRVKAQATGYVDSVWSATSATPFSASYTLVGLVESPTNTFEAQASGNYGSNYGVDATNVQSGAFTFTASLDNTTNNPEGMMFGVSSSSTNSAWNVGNWEAGGYVANSSLAVMKIVNGVATTTGQTATLSAGNTLKITRDGSNVVKLLYNDVEIHDFGTITGNLYFHISAYTNKYIILD